MRKAFCFIVVLATLFTPALGFSDSFHWEFRGWYGGGCFPNITFDPQTSNRVFLTSDVAGIWRSDDLGESWQFVNEGLGHLNVSQVEISSDAKMIYAATSGGLYFSQDIGNKWDLAETLKGEIKFTRPESYKSVAVSPLNAQHVCVGTMKGKVFCSTDHGQHWQNLDSEARFLKSDKPIAALQWSHEGKYLFIGASEGFYVFDFQAQQWLTRTGSPKKFTDLVFISNQQRLYAAAEGQLWQSFDLGEHWQKSPGALPGSIFRLQVVPSQDEQQEVTLYAAVNQGWNGKILRTDDFGQNWTSVEKNTIPDIHANPTWSWANPHGKMTALKADPFKPQVMFKTDWWGVFRTDDGGQTWKETILGAPNTVGTDLWVDDQQIWAATMDNGLLTSRDQGQSYQSVFPVQGFDPVKNGHVWRIIQPRPGEFLATSSPWNDRINQVIVSTDEGKTFAIVREGLPKTRPQKNTMWAEGYPRALTFDPQNPQRIYLGMDGDDQGGLYVSDDGGRHWRRNPQQPGSLRIFRGLAVDPTDSNRLFWGACADRGGIYRSEDQGKTWQHVLKDLSWVFDVAVAGDGTIYAVGDKGGPVLYLSKDHGMTWQKGAALPSQGAAVSIAIQGQNSHCLAVSTTQWGNASGGKIFVSRDQGQSFVDVTGDLPPGLGAAALAFSSSGKELWMSRYAGGIYQLKLE